MEGAYSDLRPGANYVKGRQDWPEADRFQLQFHKSTHIIRAMFPGNGAGKTTVAAMEADYWLQHLHPAQQTPTWPVQVIWVCLKFQQMDELREQLEATCLTRGYRFNDTDHRYTWPNKSTMTIFSNDGDWESFQGINPDLVIVDEECDERKWTELAMRRRGRKQTRYVISATATKGKRWMFHDIYEPWLKFHTDLGMDIDGAIKAQKHPDIWCWPKGGLEDNPGAKADDPRWQAARLSGRSPQEQQVRRRGGFQDFNAAPVFNLDALNLMEETSVAMGVKGVEGWIEVKSDKDGKPIKGDYDFMPGMAANGNGRITIYEAPTDDYYTIGADFAYGIENRDRDAACVFRQKTGMQVACAVGRWGDVNFAYVLYSLAAYYKDALIVGERQVGLPILRRLFDEWEYRRIYYEQDETKRYPRFSDSLGHHKAVGDLLVPRLAFAISPVDRQGVELPPEVLLTDPETIEECRQFEWRPRRTALDLSDARNNEMIMSAPPGQHDDLVMACAYGYLGLRSLPRFPKHEKTFAPQSLGDILGHRKVLAEMALAKKK